MDVFPPVSGRVAVGEMFRDEAAFVMDVQRYMAFDQRTLHLLLNTTLPNNLAVRVCLQAVHALTRPCL